MSSLDAARNPEPWRKLPFLGPCWLLGLRFAVQGSGLRVKEFDVYGK